MAPGDTLVAFTDGISEAMNRSDDEWGEAALIQSVEGCSGLPAKEVLDRVRREAARRHDAAGPASYIARRLSRRPHLCRLTTRMTRTSSPTGT
jgi:Stage II sporulation protein E (SpoIIE)